MGNLNCKINPNNNNNNNNSLPLYHEVINIKRLTNPEYIELFNLRNLKDCEIELLILSCTKPPHIESHILQLLKDQILGPQYCRFLMKNLNKI